MRKKELKLLRGVLVTSVIAIGSWAVFWGIVRIFDLNEINPIVLIIVGLIIIFITNKFGIKQKY